MLHCRLNQTVLKLTLLVSALINIKPCSARCQGNNVLRGKKGTFFSPGFSTKYSDGVDCVYRIVVPRGHRVKLAITKLDIEYCKNCRCDFLELRDGSNRKSPLLGRFCDSKAVTTFYSTKRHLWVRFKSDMKTKYQGFSAVFVAQRGRKVSDVVSLNRSKGIFTSPNYPRHYGKRQRKLWLLQVKSGRCIKLYFKQLNLRPCSNSIRCECNYIRIGEGRNNSVASYGEYCGQSIPSKLISRGAQIWVEFVRNSNLTSAGFQAIYEETQCISPTNALKQDKFQLLTAIMCSLLLVICVALLCVIPRAIVRRRRDSHKQRNICKCHEHRIKDFKVEKHNQHQKHHHHHVYRHHFSDETKKDINEKQEKAMNLNKDRRNVYKCKCNYEGESPPSSKRQECCDGKSISYLPVSQCSLLSSLSSASST